MSTVLTFSLIVNVTLASRAASEGFSATVTVTSVVPSAPDAGATVTQSAFDAAVQAAFAVTFTVSVLPSPASEMLLLERVTDTAA